MGKESTGCGYLLFLSHQGETQEAFAVYISVQSKREERTVISNEETHKRHNFYFYVDSHLGSHLAISSTNASLKYTSQLELAKTIYICYGVHKAFLAEI
jgi:hypothetical protein